MAEPTTLNATAIFAELCEMVGNWQGVNEEGHDVSIAYSLNANDTVLVEHWFFHNDMEALTIYHLDGRQLMATHYCPVGNQPRLDLMRRTADGTLEFEYRSATNLPDFAVDHQHAFDLRILGHDKFHRNETYLCAGASDSNGTTFMRAA